MLARHIASPIPSCSLLSSLPGTSLWTEKSPQTVLVSPSPSLGSLTWPHLGMEVVHRLSVSVDLGRFINDLKDSVAVL